MKRKKKYATGGLVDYSQESPLNSFLLGSNQEPIVEEVTPSQSIFGDDFLGFNTPTYTPEEDEETNERATVNNLSNSAGIDNFLSSRESGGDYSAMSSNSSATGKYQFIWSIHKDKIKKITGIDSQEAFRNSPEAQEAYYSYYKEKELLPAVTRFSAIKKDLPGITDEQIMAAYHFAGPGNLSKAIKNKSYNQPLDANGTSIMSYLAPNSKMKNKKYENGGVAMGVGQGIAGLAPTILSMIDAMGQGYTTQPIVAQKQAQSFNPLSSSFQYALGGITGEVPIEAEGGEMMETPDGSVGEIKGPSHEEGGVDLDVPGGTKIYSDRIAIDGRTMSDRKKARTKMVEKLEKLLGKRPTDKVLRNTLKRTQEVLNAQEEKDMLVQEAAGIGSLEPQKFEEGGVARPLVPSLFESTLIGGLQPITSNPVTVPTTTYTPYTPSAGQSTGSGDNSAAGITLGDGIGMAGNLFNAFAPLLNTMRNAEASKPNENFFRDFGRDALDANEEAQDYVAGMRENALTRLAQQSNAAKASNRNNVSSLNTLRALDLASDLGTNTARNQAFDSSSQQMMNLLGQKSQLENIQDQMVMGGEQARDLADRQDLDNMFTQLGENYTNLGTNIQGLGRNINTNQGNKDMVSLMEQLSKYGLGWVRDSKGNLVLKSK